MVSVICTSVYNFLKRSLSCNIISQQFNTEVSVRKFDTINANTNTDNISYLNNINYNNTVIFVPPIYCGKVIKVYDGDTITIAAKLPNMDEPIYRFSVRLNGIDTPEIHGKTFHEKELAIAAKEALHKLIFGKIVTLKKISTEKYGRILADVYLDDLYVNQWLLNNKFATLYDGGTKIRPNDWD